MAISIFGGIASNNRIDSSNNHEMKWLSCVLLCLLIPNLAHAQISSGTIIVFEKMNDKFFIAADSKTTILGGPYQGPLDSYCKIAAFGENLVFSSSGAAFYLPRDASDPAKRWDAVQEAKAAILLNPLNLASNSDLDMQVASIADAWARAVIADLQNLYSFHPDTVRDFAAIADGTMTNGVFAIASKGEIALTVRQITFVHGIWGAARIKCANNPCAFGTDEAAEFVSITSERARREVLLASPEVLDWMGPEMAKIIRITDLVIAYDKTGFMGGPIDAAELSADGTLRWIQRKQNCPESER